MKIKKLDDFSRKRIKVASILDLFSYVGFKYECNLRQLTMNNWKQKIDQFNPHFLFVESAWLGYKGDWIGQLNNIQDMKEPEIKKLVDYCKRRNIPTVFWNKEDPIHYNEFLATAKLFDVVFTTDLNSVENYKKELGHENVHVLQFAAQPKIHNPINSNKNKKNIAFAGTWYDQQHVERAEDLKKLLTVAIPFGLDIYDRKHKTKYSIFKYPIKYQSYIVGKVNYLNISRVYKQYKIFVNVNSVKNSPTMFSRRVFELLASGTNVISSYSEGVANLFWDIIPMVQTEEEMKQEINKIIMNKELSYKMSVLGTRRVFQEHLYQHRFQTILKALEIKNDKEKVGVSIVTVLKDINNLNNMLENFEIQEWEEKELFIFVIGDQNLDHYDESLKKHKIIYLAEYISFLHVLAKVNKLAKYKYIALFNDTDYYGPHYLTDLMYAFVYTTADIVGKKAIYSFTDNGSLKFNQSKFENRYSPSVDVGTIVFKRTIIHSLLRKKQDILNKFKFLDTCRRSSYKIYSSNRFNFLKIDKGIYNEISSTNLQKIEEAKKTISV